MSWDEEISEEIPLAFQELKKVEQEEQEKEKFEENEFNRKADELDRKLGEGQIFQQMTDHETILLYGQPKVGKTAGACSFIESAIKNKGHVFIINTDNGIKRTLKWYFGNKFEEVLKYITYYLVTDFNNINTIIDEIKSKVKSNDLIIIDLIDDFWEMAQSKFVDDSCKALGISLADYIVMSSKQSEKFGLLDANKWQYTKKLDDILITRFVIQPPCNIIACCGAKDIEVAKVFAKKDADMLYELNKFEEVGSRPGGQKRLHYKFNTVIYLGERKDGKRYFIIMGDRGFLRNSQKIDFEKNFHEAFMKLRK